MCASLRACICDFEKYCHLKPQYKHKTLSGRGYVSLPVKIGNRKNVGGEQF